MARSSRSAQPRRQKSGAGWIILALVIGGVLAVVIAAPQVLEQLFGGATTPADRGDQPTVTQSSDGDTAARDGDGMDLAARGEDIGRARLAEAAPDVVTQQPDAAPVETAAPMDTRAQDTLAQAEAAYREFDWDQARSLADRVSQLNPDTTVLAQAEGLVLRANAIEALFGKLDNRDGLQRNIETHPSLLSVTYRGTDQLILPVDNLDDKNPIETANPAAYVEGLLGRGRNIPYLDVNGSGGELQPGNVSSIRPADLASILTEKQDQFDARLSQITVDENLERDALTWYEAAKFAYRNRLDETVTRMLDRALSIDPFLADTIREDAAQDLFIQVTDMLGRGNRAAASGFMRKLTRYYDDTTVYPEARAYFEGNLAQLRAATENAERERREQRERARQERVRVAQATRDAEEAARVAREAEAEREREAAREREREAERRRAEADTGSDTGSSSAGSGSSGEADEIYERAMEIYARAQTLGVSAARDRLYAEAEPLFTRARDLYAAAGNDAKMVEANSKRYACIKYRRTF